MECIPGKRGIQLQCISGVMHLCTWCILHKPLALTTLSTASLSGLIILIVDFKMTLNIYKYVYI